MNRNKIIIISIVVIVLILLGSLLVYLFTGSEDKKEDSFWNRIFPTVGDKDALDGETTTLIDRAKDKKKPRLIQLTDVSVAGIKNVSNGRVRYIERGTGHLYEISGDGEDKIRISNTTIPKVFDVMWSRDGDMAILSYLENDISAKYFSAIFSGTSTEGVFLPELSIPWEYAPHKDRFLYTAKIDDNYSIIAADPDNSNQIEVYSTPFADFIVKWPTDNIISLATRPSHYANGYLYKIDLSGGVFDKIIGGIRGMQALWSPDGENILISDNNITSQIISNDGKFLNNGPNTLASKCVWSATTTQSIMYCGISENIPNGLYPDDWYKGKISFEDKIYKINANTGDINIIIDEWTFDIDEITIDENDEYLYFRDKKDGTLWGLKLGN